MFKVASNNAPDQAHGGAVEATPSRKTPASNETPHLSAVHNTFHFSVPLHRSQYRRRVFDAAGICQCAVHPVKPLPQPCALGPGSVVGHAGRRVLSEYVSAFFPGASSSGRSSTGESNLAVFSLLHEIIEPFYLSLTLLRISPGVSSVCPIWLQPHSLITIFELHTTPEVKVVVVYCRLCLASVFSNFIYHTYMVTVMLCLYSKAYHTSTRFLS